MCVSVYCVCCIIARSKGAFAAVQRAGSDDQSLRTLSAKKHQSPTASTHRPISLSPFSPFGRPRLLLNYYSHLLLPLIKLALPTTACVAYTLTGFFKSKLITISRAASLTRTGETGREREEQRVDGKINFPSELCALSFSLVVRR